MLADIQAIFSYDQTHAIPHWLWNQPSAPPVHPEGDVKGCLGNAVKVSEPQKVSSHQTSWTMNQHDKYASQLLKRLGKIQQQPAARYPLPEFIAFSMMMI